MFGQLLPNKNKIATMWYDIYYAKFGYQLWYLNKAGVSYSSRDLYTVFGFMGLFSS
jgi:hypothetical protein